MQILFYNKINTIVSRTYARPFSTTTFFLLVQFPIYYKYLAIPITTSFSTIQYKKKASVRRSPTWKKALLISSADYSSFGLMYDMSSLKLGSGLWINMTKIYVLSHHPSLLFNIINKQTGFINITHTFKHIWIWLIYDYSESIL